MCKSLFSARWEVLVILGLAVVVISAAADDKRASDSPPTRPRTVLPQAVELCGGDQQIMKVLDEPTDMDFVETPLKDVVQAISIRHKGIPIALDLKAITDAGGSADTPITFQLKGISLRSALRHMLHEHELDFVIHDEVLLFTAEDRPTGLRQFDVGDLIERGVSTESLINAMVFALPRSSDNPANSAQPGAAAPARGRTPWGPAGGVGAPPAEKFGGGASTTTIPDGEVMPFQSVLLVRATDRGHANVETFLAELRHHMSKHEGGDKASVDR